VVVEIVAGVEVEVVVWEVVGVFAVVTIMVVVMTVVVGGKSNVFYHTYSYQSFFF
jgi:hypothetical protein